MTRGTSSGAENPVNLDAAAHRLAGRVAVIVGGGSTGEDAAYPGTGSAIARVFAAAGASVCVIGRSQRNTDRTVQWITDEGGTAFGLTGDATDTTTCERLIETAVETYGGVDVLVNNLGYSERGGITDMDDAAWDRVIAVNLRSPIAMTRAAAPYLSESGHGSVIFVGAVAGLQASGSPAYGTTKAALLGLTRDAAYGLGRRGIRCNCVIPGHLYTPATAGKAALRGLRRELSMLGTEGTGWDAGWAALYLASDESRYVTGTQIVVDGGATQQLSQSVVKRLRDDEAVHGPTPSQI